MAAQRASSPLEAPRPEAPSGLQTPLGSPSCLAAGSSTDGAPGFAISVMESTRRKQTTASISRLAALTWAPGVAGMGRPVPGARTTTSSCGPPPRSGGTPGRLTASGTMRTISRSQPARMTTASRRPLPRECARSPNARRRRQRGSGPQWPLSRLPSLSEVGFARVARSGISRSATCATSATGGAPRRVSSRAECQTHGATIRTVTSLTRTTRRHLTCAKRSRRNWRQLSSPSSARPGPRGAPALRSGATPTEGPKAAAPRVSIPRAVGKGWRSSVAWCRCGCVHLPRHWPGARPLPPPPAAAARWACGTAPVRGR